MNTSRIAVALSVLALIVAGGAVVLPEREIQTQTIVQKDGRPAVGALSGPDISSPYLRWGGVQRVQARTEAMNAASTTICSIQSPSSTSTLEFVAFQPSTATTAAVTIRAYKSVSKWITTTNLAQAGFSASSLDALMSTSTGVGANGIFSPDTYLVFTSTPTAGGAGAYTAVGACQAAWTVL